MEKQKDTFRLVDIKSGIRNGFARFLYSIVEKPVEKFLGITDLNAAYERVRQNAELGNFYERALDAIGIEYEIDEDDLKKIPAKGPLVIVSNHPFGGMDGIVLGAILQKVRPDAKIIVNSLLARMVEIKPYCIEVNPFGGKEAASENVSAIKETIRHLKNGGCIGTFPSGTVSYLHSDFCISDPEWNTNIANIARRTGAALMPVFFDGRNSPFFYAMGVIHPRLRTLFLVKEMFRGARKSPVRLIIGSLIPNKKLAEFETDAELTSWMRINSYILGGRNNKGESQNPLQIRNIQKGIEKIFPMMHKKMQEIILPIDPEKMENEIRSLPESACLIKGEKFSVYCAESWQIKNTVLEIGRLREVTFREVGEGTGKSVDNDEFDQYYLHMFMWDSENKRIAGAYRIGRTDKIINSLGVQGLYASTLFKIRPELMERISPALEMGRSFIAPDYQKKRSTLAILWRGIGEFLYRNPQYRTLYGPVSISTAYNSFSKDLIIQFLREKRTSEELAKFVKAKKPPKIRMKTADRKALLSSAHDIEHISALVSEIEFDNKGIPTLLKHYLKLDGELLAFNVDNDFGNCIDGLIMVDMLKADPKLLKSYMGEKQTAEYRKKHGFDTPELQHSGNE